MIDVMAESRGQIPFVAYDADGRLDQDLPCLKCGYNLRTLFDDGQCPECGASVHESARLAWLCQHDPAWLRRLARATIWIGIAMVWRGKRDRPQYDSLFCLKGRDIPAQSNVLGGQAR